MTQEVVRRVFAVGGLYFLFGLWLVVGTAIALAVHSTWIEWKNEKEAEQERMDEEQEEDGD